ncbi:MAG: Type 1 glutamine amidotransferase-like domain-containing protein [Clostridia bacterium]|nr:Type 1 glutamine amidotransferase-like domain-containing protein [Clostridia bacterium]
MDKYVIAIGGGEIKNKTTLKIDEFIVNLAKKHAGENRAVGLFLGTASHDSMPYFNSFRKTYTSVFDIKADVALTVYGEMDFDHIKEKFDKADMLYIGGGDTKFMLDKWKETGILSLILDAYERGVIIAGLSAGAICWFENMYTDYDLMRNEEGEYKLLDGLGVLKGLCSPHYDLREKDYHEKIVDNGLKEGYGIENDSALLFINGELKGSLSSGGKSYFIENKNGVITRKEIPLYE